MKLILHIGSDKCGSTAIQASLAINREILIENGIYIPVTGFSENNGHAKCFIDQSRHTFKQLITELEYANSNYAYAIVSWEGLHFILEAELSEKYSQLRKFNTIAFYFVRDQAEIIQTGLLQQWKTSNSVSHFEKVLPENRNYFTVAERWTEFLGAKTKVSIYDREKFPNNDIVWEFYSCILPKKLPDLVAFGKDKNSSLSYESAYILSIFDRHFALGGNLRNDFIDALIKSQKSYRMSKYFLSEEDVIEIRRHYKMSNQQLIEAYQVDPVPKQNPCWINSNYKPGLHAKLLAESLELFDVAVFHSTNYEGNNLRKFVKSGWYSMEEWGCWAKGNRSIIKFRLLDDTLEQIIKNSGNSFLTISGHYFYKVMHKSDLTVNGTIYKGIDLTNFSFQAKINDFLKNGVMQLTIDHYENVSPKEVNMNSDIRKLSYGIESIELRF